MLIVKNILEMKQIHGKTLMEANFEILVVPQATLGGKAKKQNIQYHSNQGKMEGEILFQEFVSCLRESAKGLRVQNGILFL